MRPAGCAIAIGSNGRTVVSVDDFSFVGNEITFLFGESGIGKSMLCKAVYGQLDPDELEVTVNGRPYREYLAAPETIAVRQSSFFVFQEPSSHLHPLMRIGHQLREGSIAGTESEERILSRFWKTSDKVKLKGILDLYPKPYRPSGGEKQRVLLAMAFKKIALHAVSKTTRPTFFVFDEPTGSLDNSYRDLFLGFLFEEYRKRPFTTMVITHDYSIISEVRRNHNDLIGRIHYKELSRIGEGRVALRDFSPEDYLVWLERRTAARTAEAPRSGREEEVLRVAPEFGIFGRSHRIFSDPARTRPAELVIRRGEMVYVKAPSGVGKTTLAKIVIGLYAPEKFSMKLCGKEITEKTPRIFFEREVWGRRAGMVFQHADEALDLEATVAETFKGLPLGYAMTGEKLLAALAELFEGGVPEAFLGKKVKFLSGGQKQRLNLLRTIILHPDLIILDEPLNGLDFDSVRRIIDLLEEKREAGSALLMISHNEEIFDALVDAEHCYYLA
ncbi:MAG: ATP-binding cassette domain-containing protein [Chitinispirillaceae bacterium]|nr:ATP-binding cassette domain-containing protein [Chitinispirillaceae bacterium]